MPNIFLMYTIQYKTEETHKETEDLTMQHILNGCHAHCICIADSRIANAHANKVSGVQVFTVYTLPCYAGHYRGYNVFIEALEELAVINITGDVKDNSN